LSNGGKAYGAYDGDKLVGFGVLAHQFRGKEKNQLQLDLMYVSRNYRRQGIGSRIFHELSQVAMQRGASQLYISATETESAVGFYSNLGSTIASEVDEELLRKEPRDIHMTRNLS
jgi:GNAT superfamily N-acetyltransferase